MKPTVTPGKVAMPLAPHHGPDPVAEWRTVVDVLRWRATNQPDRRAYRFLLDGELREASFTYGDLDRRARTIAATLQSVGDRGDRVLLAYPPGPEFVAAYFGCLYAGFVAVVVAPPHPARVPQFLDKAARIASDARPRAALTTAAILDQLAVAEAAEPAWRGVRWLTTDPNPEGPAPEWQDPAVTGDDLAFLQYTSGSTADPKGVMVSHGNLVANLRLIRVCFGDSPEWESVIWLPPYHDMGLIGGILAPLFIGSPVSLMPPLAFVQRPRRWLQAISRLGARVSGGPNFAYDLCVRKITPEQRDRLDLSGWRVAFNGAEPIHPETIERFAAYFEPCGFRPEAFMPCYGLAEATLLVSATALGATPRILALRRRDLEQHRAAPCKGDDGDACTQVASGHPVVRTVIVDPEALTPCPADGIGEIWVSGPSIAKGYWDHPDESACTFGGRLCGTVEGSFLRTGDLGFLHDGELFVTGRLKDLVIIDGANHAPQDIERTVAACHEALEGTDVAAFSVETAGREELVVVAAVPSTRADGEAVRRAIRSAVSGCHDLRIHDLVLVKAGGVPKTSSGKIRRSACRTLYLAGTLETWRSA